MINALAGLMFGMLAADWLTRLILPVGWGFVACVYHGLFSVRQRQLFLEEYRRRGHHRRTSRLIYYGRRYRRAFVISGVFSLIGGLIAGLR